ncbi:MASE1 domain-containing protein [Brenneria goodwinii]|uniref:MASE1 domain-containing sensor histidine kinase n=1 Tax=Brenneria goodwinii TaxID=1109412 RepID=UPI000EF239C7|nr:MASE1 domain-containing protein [Brenneria goodwinii]MCG8157689.1 MASE1 domain-containing protein [Brenneria goodwinii]MCG8161070.1 MASE1 domain-containing protein [Brenneria goodwinii]MCG8165512.1 MASE1 domain-containing protein [Brenneria goodwinii]MCG8169995.1 MASE1 domain-containing protein [Brenneria goodwinii]MCG8176800.1 MASE1 domain-containing protein [Brenneria goodwinii]
MFSPRSAGMMLFLIFFYGLSWLALWTISFYLSNNGQQAILLLPQGLRLALMILLPRKYWPTILLSEMAIQVWLIREQLQPQVLMLFSPWLSLLPATITQKIWRRYTLYWQRLLLLLAALTLNSILHGLVIGPLLLTQITQTLLATFTGGVLLIPFTYLIHEYIKQQHLQTLLAQALPDPPLRTSLLIWCSLIFLISVCLQITFTPEMERLLLIFVFLPNVVMAYKFGWQGGVLSAVLGSLMITITRQVSGAFSDLRELELFLSTQALLGIGLGIAISRQQQLAQRLQRYRQQLEQELKTRHRLMERIIHTEEEVRKDIARELHDDIGQNITAIQIQAMLVKHAAPEGTAQQAAGQISELSQRIHHTTRQLLRRLRPPVLDEIVLDKALRHLADEFAFNARGIGFNLDYRLPQQSYDDVVMFTLYRLLQELLNNINKHAFASQIDVLLYQRNELITLEVADDGIGIPADNASGFGLRGIEERVRALGGNWQVQAKTPPSPADEPTRRKGTHIIVNLPTKFKQKA